MAGADVLSVDTRAVYEQLLAIADHAGQQRGMKTCSAKQVAGILEAYAATRTLCHELTYREKATPLSLPDLGRIADDKRYTVDELKAILTVVEIECFKGIGTLAGIITLVPKEEARHE